MKSQSHLGTAMFFLALGTAAFTAPVSATAQQIDPAQLLARADANGDGQITRAEFQQARTRLFERLDQNRDGYLDSSDAPRRPLARQQARERLSQLVQAFDVNRDGRVSRDEFIEGPSFIFAHADRDGNGLIDAHELQALRQSAER